MKKYQKYLLSIPLFILILAGNLSSVVAVIPSRTYTLDADFDEGTLVGLEHDTVHDQLQLSEAHGTLPFIWVPNSNEATVSKYDTVTGNELGRYRTGPPGPINSNPSRTTVDLEGSVWFGNRGTGTVVKIGLYEKGNWIDKNLDGDCDTSEDTNNDGKITGSEILPWGTDECVLFEVLLGNSGSAPRGIAIDANNDLWAGTYGLGSLNRFYHIDGQTGAIIDTINIYGYRSYGALIDGNGNIWSSSLSSYLLKINPTTKSITLIWPLLLTSYGLGIDNLGHVFVAGWGQNKIAKIDINTHAITYGIQYDTNCRGVAVTSDNDVWVVNSHDGDVTRLDNDLNWEATIDVGTGVMTTGVAVDAAGKVWACNYNDGYLHRINPTTNSIDLSVQTVGMTGTGVGQHYSYSDMTGIIAWSVTTKSGTWTVDFDSELPNAPWGTVEWNSFEPSGTSVTVKVRSSNDGSIWSSWETAVNGILLSSTPNGRYLQIETTLQITSGDVSPILKDLSVEVGNRPPVADAGPDQDNIEQTSHVGAEVTLDGSGSYDPDGDSLTYLWTWIGGSATGISPTVTFPLGTTTVILTVVDGLFSDTDTVDITVVDTTPPETTVLGYPIILWPPNHKYHTIDVSDFVISVTDICDANVDVDDVVITSVSSDEPENVKSSGDGNTINDMVIVDSQTVELRAERQGEGNGRVYTINFEVTDGSGNTAVGSFRVWIPHDQKPGSIAVDDGPAYTVYPS